MAPARLELRVCSLYPDRLNLYGDRGNLMVLARRCAWRGIGFSATAADVGAQIDPERHDLLYMGGGEDRDQRVAGLDLLETKAAALRAAAARGAVVLGICGGFQMLGTSYEVAGERLAGAGVLDAATTRPPGERLIGPVAVEASLGDGDGRVLAGFENHGGRTQLGPGERPLGRVLSGHGYDGGEGIEGARRGRVIGTYLHGPLLAKNAWFADWLIAAALGIGVEDLPPLDDRHEAAAHRSAVRAATAAASRCDRPGAPQPDLHDEVWMRARLDDHLDAVYGLDGDGTAPGALLPRAPESSLTYTKVAVARAAGRVSRAARRGAGTAAPGRLLLRLAPDALGRLGERLPRGSILVSGTNGKTTTARMLAAMLRADGRAIVHNHAGANGHWGVATALVDQTGEQGVFELDEAWLPLVAAQLRPRVILLGNLSRDRLDGYGEVERVATLWRRMVDAHPEARLVVNADDPRLAALSQERDCAMRFGIDDPSIARAEPGHPRDGRTCPACGAEQDYSRAFVGHLGHYACPGCGARRPEPEVVATSVRLDGAAGSRVAVSTPLGELELELALPGLHNVYNALGAIATALSLGAAPAALQRGLETTEVPFGRAETIRVHDTPVGVWLMKNPIGANAIFETLAHEPDPPGGRDLWLALNDRGPDGRDVSWIWDVDFESFARRVDRVTCAGRRASELALRLRHAGWPVGADDVDENLARSFERAVARAPTGLVALPTYTALLELEAVLDRHGAASPEWAAGAPRLVAG